MRAAAAADVTDTDAAGATPTDLVLASSAKRRYTLIRDCLVPSPLLVSEGLATLTTLVASIEAMFVAPLRAR